ncbi:unnamed protein product [Cylindrotheca closterium]|uniref:Uncharacterized protein n=1 Tax=Cylindrotheca closterium TaxID=2856 RepID=A0AAD2G116_9STRA|nr:unnamed protein product [Cylindrotheca closterium]
MQTVSSLQRNAEMQTLSHGAPLFAVRASLGFFCSVYETWKSIILPALQILVIILLALQIFVVKVTLGDFENSKW